MKALCSSRLNTPLMIGPGIALLQHRGGIFDSSVEACVIRTRRHASQYVWEQGRVCSALFFLKSSLQHMQELYSSVVSYYIIAWATYFKSSSKVFRFFRVRNRFLIPFLRLTDERRVETENNDGVGSEGIGGGLNPLAASGASACAK
jgi:hypothetical protein